MKLILLRHGESEANVNNVFVVRGFDPSLTFFGVKQIINQAELLKNVKLAAIYTSPLLRASQTADIVGDAVGLKPLSSMHLSEIDVGMLDGKSQRGPHNRRLYQEILRRWETDPDVAFPGGESLTNVKNRFSSFLKITGNPKIPILVVSHCGFFMSIIWAFCQNHGPTFEHGHMGRGCISIIFRIGGKFRLVTFNNSPDASFKYEGLCK